MEENEGAESPAQPEADPAEVAATRRRRRFRIILTVQGVIVGGAVISTVLALTLRSSDDSGRPAGTTADQVGTRTTTSRPPGAGPSGTGQPGAASPTVAGVPSGAGLPTTTNPPTTFGSIVVTDQVLHAAPASPLRYQIVVHYPAVSGLTDSARQEQVNTQLRAPADQALAGFTADFGKYPAGSGDNGFATTDDEVQVAGKLISARFDTVFRFPGAGSLNQGTKAITVRLDTAGPVATSAMFTPDGLSDTGQRALVLGLQSQPDIAECNANPGYGTKELRAAVASTLTGQGGGAVTVTKDGLKFSFAGGSIGPNSCGVVTGTLSFASLAHIVDPGLVTLATSA